MCPDQKKITHLQSLAAKLNDVSDSLNESIQNLNTTLADMNLGVAVWPYIYLDTRTAIINEEERDEQTIVSGQELGYAKANGEWQICVRAVTFKNEVDESGEEFEKYLNQGVPVPLMNAPRAIRLEACRSFDNLLDHLAYRAQSYINDVEKAAKLV